MKETIVSRLGTFAPVLPVQFTDARELAHIRGDQNEFASQCLPGDQEIVCTDRAAALLQIRAHLPGQPSIRFLETGYLNGTCKKFTYARKIGLHLRTFGSAVQKLEYRNGRHKYAFTRLNFGLKADPNGLRLSFD